ncbi:TPA: hypothetical protein MIO45_28015, partial [Klebsiella pneumoniae subsp. pneumoniae]|nr:hypothetical protein [Klebsiella pneumoniae subsp. pneumoniae]
IDLFSTKDEIRYHRDTIIFVVINTFDKKRCYLWRSRFRSWHRADNLNGMKVCFERGAVDFSCPFAADNCHLLQLTSDVVVTNVT